MASINSVTGSLSSTSSLRGFGGLASGLERDELIEQLTYGTRTKIENQQKKKDKLGWQQSAIRNIIDKVYDYSNKYTSYASSSNLTSTTMFSRTDITAVGENSKYVSVTGRSSTANTLSILGVKQMAKDAQISGARASSSTLQTGGVSSDLTDKFNMSMIAGQSLTFKVGGDSYSVTLGSGDKFQYDTPQNLQKALNDSFAEVDIRGDKKLSDVLEAQVSSDGRVTFKNKDTAGNSIEIKGGTGDALTYLGVLTGRETVSSVGSNALTIKSGGTLTAKGTSNVMQEVELGKYLGGNTLTFNYNGTSKTIEIGKNLKTMGELKDDLQKKLDESFGKERVKVELTAAGDGKQSLSFQTITPGGKADASSVFGITGGGRGLLGKSGIFGIDSGTSNKINTSQSLKEAGFNLKDENNQDIITDDKTNPAELIFTVKGADGNPTEKKIDISWDDSVDDIMKKINEDKDLNMTISYQRNSDRFIITSKEKGASGNIEMKGNVAEILFGKTGEELKNSGQDAIVAVQFAGDSEPTEIVRDSNSFTMDGLTFGLKGTFGYKKNANGEDSIKDQLEADIEPITFDAKVDTENVLTTVREMIEAYNDIVETINTEVKTKPNRSYEPLTASQRENMSESEIKAYEEKAKEGLLFSDTDLRSFADALRFILPTTDRAALSKIGISVSSSYSDNGKLVLDETKFKAALESDPESVGQLFTRTSSVDENGNKIEGGLMEKISNVMKTYAGTTGATKGILVERAGSSHAPTTVLKNSIQEQLDDIDDYIDRLLDKLETEEDRYIAQFTTLETLMSQMNSQSSYLSQLGGF